MLAEDHRRNARPRGFRAAVINPLRDDSPLSTIYGLAVMALFCATVLGLKAIVLS